MKFLWLTLLAATISSATATQAQTPKEPRRLELLKCISPKFGTLWASFGRQRTLIGETITTFPTEIVFFDNNNQMDRQTFPNVSDGLKVPVKVEDTLIEMEFYTLNSGAVKNNKLRAVQVDWSDPHGFFGEWKIQNFDEPPAKDKVFCSVH